MSLLVNNMNPTATRHKFKKDIINNTVRYLGTPAPMAVRINDYFNYLTFYSHPGPDGIALISQLPYSMFQDISMWQYKDLVTKVWWGEGSGWEMGHLHVAVQGPGDQGVVGGGGRGEERVGGGALPLAAQGPGGQDG